MDGLQLNTPQKNKRNPFEVLSQSQLKQVSSSGTVRLSLTKRPRQLSSVDLTHNPKKRSETSLELIDSRVEDLELEKLERKVRLMEREAAAAERLEAVRDW